MAGTESAKYPQWFLQMMQDFLDMRDAQKEFFEKKGDFRKRIAIARELKADSHLDQFAKAGLIHHKRTDNNSQKKLF